LFAKKDQLNAHMTEAKQNKAAISDEIKNKIKEINSVEANVKTANAKVEGLKMNQKDLKVDINNIKLLKQKFKSAFNSKTNTKIDTQVRKAAKINRG